MLSGVLDKRVRLSDLIYDKPGASDPHRVIDHLCNVVEVLLRAAPAEVQAHAMHVLNNPANE